MEPTGGKDLIRVSGKELQVVLTPYQVKKMDMGVTSTYLNQSLVGLGVGYTTLKELTEKPGDAYFVSFGSQFSMVDAGDGRTESKMDVKKKLKYTGPKVKLFLPAMRAVVMKQPYSGIPTDKVKNFLTACYDKDHVVFVSDTGKCLYIYRSHLINPDNPEEGKKNDE